MGLPNISVIFKQKAETAIKRSGNGIVALILADNTKEDTTTHTYTQEKDIVKSHWTPKNLDYLNKAFMGNPKSVIVERISTEGTYDDALARLSHKKWNYLAIPSLPDEKVSEISTWIIAQRAAKKTFKAVLPHSESDNIGIINFDTEECVIGTKTYTAAEYCVRIAGLLAGISLDESATGKTLSELTSIKESLTPDTDIDSGKFILVNDGEKIEVGRAVNSLVTVDNVKTTEDMKSVKIVEGMDLISDDIRASYKTGYVGRNNSLENKELFIAAVNQYFTGLVKSGVLFDGYDHYAEIDVEAQREWLSQKYDVSEMSDAEIKQQPTGTIMFMAGHVQMQNAAEDLNFTVYM